MLELQEVLNFIQNADQQELSQIMRVSSIRKSEINFDTKQSFRVGDIVGIDHKKINKNDQFKINKINGKTITVEKINVGNGRIGAQMRVSPSLLVKK
tara:strand:+ start:137 stop:427 length:291 start_codon:yes stop_codon:yes gene_type:complete